MSVSLPFPTPSSALYASRLYLSRYQITHPERLAKHTPGGPRIRGTTPSHHCHLLSHTLGAYTLHLRCGSEGSVSPHPPTPVQMCFGVSALRLFVLLLGNVYIHPTAKVAPSAVVSCGPNLRERLLGLVGIPRDWA